MSKQSHDTVHNTDVVIIGAGPVGLFAIFEAGMLQMRCHVVDTLDMIGGQCVALYPEKPIYDIPAYPSINAIELVEKLQEQAAPFSPHYHLGQQVTAVKKQENGRWKVTTSKGTEILCKVIVIAAGCGAFGPNRPPLENIEQHEANGTVQYMVGKREAFRKKRVVIAGGGDSAVDWAISLSELTEKLYVIHRRPKFRAAPENTAKLQQLHDAGKIELVIPYQLDRLEGEGGKLSAVIVKTLDGNERRLEADILLPFFGLSMELGPIAEWGLSLHMNHVEVEASSCATNLPGIFAIGDIATYPGKLKLILNGFAEAAMAMHSAYPLVHEGEALHFEYSTTKGVVV